MGAHTWWLFKGPRAGWPPSTSPAGPFSSCPPPLLSFPFPLHGFPQRRHGLAWGLHRHLPPLTAWGPTAPPDWLRGPTDSSDGLSLGGRPMLERAGTGRVRSACPPCRALGPSLAAQRPGLCPVCPCRWAALRSRHGAASRSAPGRAGLEAGAGSPAEAPAAGAGVGPESTAAPGPRCHLAV